MHTQSSEPRGGSRLERAIILQLLRDDRDANWSREELLRELGGEMPPLEEALARLQDDTSSRFQISRCRRLPRRDGLTS